MSKFNPSSWKADFYRQSPLFSPLIPAYQILRHSHSHWPVLHDYQALLKPDILNNNQKPITFVTQADFCEKFEDQYEPRIFLTGEVQTRLNNWHDFFQVLIWKIFPETKSLLNALHFKFASERNKEMPLNKQRTAVENFLTLFDECGIIVASSDEKLLTMIKSFQWPSLFLNNRDQFSACIECFVFGHAMYEKALNPYIGMTAHAVLLPVELEFFKKCMQEKLQFLDILVKNWIRTQDKLKPDTLHPFPLLGVPGWYQGRQDKAFYDNSNYFRPGRSRQKDSLISTPNTE